MLTSVMCALVGEMQSPVLSPKILLVQMHAVVLFAIAERYNGKYMAHGMSLHA